jgi:hypothetical protein
MVDQIFGDEPGLCQDPWFRLPLGLDLENRRLSKRVDLFQFRGGQHVDSLVSLELVFEMELF